MQTAQCPVHPPFLPQNLTFETTSAFFAKRDAAFGDAQMRTLHFIGEVTNNMFRITLPNLNCTETVTSIISDSRSDTVKSAAKEDREDAVIELCRKNGSVSRKDVQEALQISQATVILLLKKMVSGAVSVKSGSGNGIKYILNQLMSGWILYCMNI